MRLFPPAAVLPPFSFTPGGAAPSSSRPVPSAAAAAAAPPAPQAAPPLTGLPPRAGTFVVSTDLQRQNLEALHRNEQHLTEAYTKYKPLCFRARGYQKTHPVKQQMPRHVDADVTLCSPWLLGVADGVSQIADFGIDPSVLPREVLKECERLAAQQLDPDAESDTEETYAGPQELLRKAFQATQSLGSLTALLAIMDNNTWIHGKCHPMLAIISVGDCEMLVLRRDTCNQLEPVARTQMQRIDGNAQTPLQIVRVDGRIDASFDDNITLDVIDRGSAVTCTSAYEGDIVVMGSDGVFDNLFMDEIVMLLNRLLPYTGRPVQDEQLQLCAEEIVKACHHKTLIGPNGERQPAPIGPGGKTDDTAVVVGEMREFTKVSRRLLGSPRRRRAKTPRPAQSFDPWRSLLARFNVFVEPIDNCCQAGGYESTEEEDLPDEPALGLPAAALPAIADQEAASQRPAFRAAAGWGADAAGFAAAAAVPEGSDGVPSEGGGLRGTAVARPTVQAGQLLPAGAAVPWGHQPQLVGQSIPVVGGTGHRMAMPTQPPTVYPSMAWR